MNDLVADVIDALKIEHCAITAQIMLSLIHISPAAPIRRNRLRVSLCPPATYPFFFSAPLSTIVVVSILNIDRLCKYISVSYTPLDVYKRQA